MPKAKKDNSVQEEPKKTPELEDIMVEGKALEEEEAKKAEETAKAKEEEEKNTVEVDLDEEAKKTEDKILEKVEETVAPLKDEIAKLAEAGKDKQEKSQFAKDLEALEAKAKAEGRDLTYAEAFEYIANKSTETAMERIKEEQAEEKKLQTEKEEADKKAQTEQEEANFKYWQKQLQDMEDNEMLPKMVKPEKGDKGFDARVRLYGFMQSTWKSETPLTNMYEVFNKFYKPDAEKRSVQPPGADAPVNMGGENSGGQEDAELKYSEIHSSGGDLERTLTKIMMDASKQ